MKVTLKFVPRPLAVEEFSAVVPLEGIDASSIVGFQEGKRLGYSDGIIEGRIEGPPLEGLESWSEGPMLGR